MDEDVIIVDEEEMSATQQTQPEPSTPVASTSTSAPSGSRTSSRLRISSQAAIASMASLAAAESSSSERTTRSRTSKAQPKLKFKLSEKAAAQAPGMSFLGQYDRELDSDDEELAFEEQFILRMPPGEDCEKLRKMVAAREVSNDVWFKFKGELPHCCGQEHF